MSSSTSLEIQSVSLVMYAGAQITRVLLAATVTADTQASIESTAGPDGNVDANVLELWVPVRWTASV